MSIGFEQSESVEDTLRFLEEFEDQTKRKRVSFEPEQFGSDEYSEQTSTSRLVSLAQAVVQGALDVSTTGEDTNPIVLQAVGALVGLLNPPYDEVLSTGPETEEIRQPDDRRPGNFGNHLDLIETEEEEVRRHPFGNSSGVVIIEKMEHDSVRIPVFSGKPSENPREWLERYENIALFKKWDDAAKLQHVPLFLDETALNWYRILKPDDKKEWKDFKANFLEVFEQDRYQQRVEIQLQHRVQEAHESPIKFYFDVLRLCKMVEEKTGKTMDETTKVENLLRGLQPYLVKKLWPLVPDTIKDTSSFLVEMKRHHEAAEVSRYSMARELNNPALSLMAAMANQMKSSARLPTSAAPLLQQEAGMVKRSTMVTRDEFDKQAEDFKKMFNELKKEKQVANRGPDKPFGKPKPNQGEWKPKCFNCNKLGHVARNCRQPRKEHSQKADEKHSKPIHQLNVHGSHISARSHYLQRISSASPDRHRSCGFGYLERLRHP